MEILKRSIPFLLLLTFYTAEATVVKNEFSALKEGKIITGAISVELKTQSEIECSRRCRDDANCSAYQFMKLQEKNCMLVNENSTLGAQTFMTNTGMGVSVITKLETPFNKEPETTRGPVLVRYWNFDSDDNIELHNGAMIVDDGKLNEAVYTDGVDDWVDLGFVTEACITRPDTCGPEGAALAMWMRPRYEYLYSFGITSCRHETTGFLMEFDISSFVFYTFVTRGYFYVYTIKPTGWSHVVLNYIGPNEGEGIVLYTDGAEVSRDTSINSDTYFAGDGKVVIGRHFPDLDGGYGKLTIDELMMFNHQLSEQQIQELYESY